MASGTVSNYADGTDSGWLDATLSSAIATGEHLYYRKIGNTVEICGTIKPAANITSGSATIATIPSEVRPMTDLTIFSASGGAGTYYPSFIYLGHTSGNLVFYKNPNMSQVSTSQSIYINGMFFLG